MSRATAGRRRRVSFPQGCLLSIHSFVSGFTLHVNDNRNPCIWPKRPCCMDGRVQSLYDATYPNCRLPRPGKGVPILETTENTIAGLKASAKWIIIFQVSAGFHSFPGFRKLGNLKTWKRSNLQAFKPTCFIGFRRFL
jgi:hypothetical protein